MDNPAPPPAPDPPPSPTTGAGKEILRECLAGEQAFAKAMQQGDPLIMEALAAFQPSPVQTADKAGPMDKDPQIEQALDRFRRLSESAKPSAGP